MANSITSTPHQFLPPWPALLTRCFSTIHCTSTWCSERAQPEPSECRRNRRGKLFQTPCIYSAALHSAGGFECSSTYGLTPSKGNARLEIRPWEQKARIKQAWKSFCAFCVYHWRLVSLRSHGSYSGAKTVIRATNKLVVTALNRPAPSRAYRVKLLKILHEDCSPPKLFEDLVMLSVPV